MNDIALVKLAYAISLFSTMIAGSIIADYYPRASRVIRAVGFLGIPAVFVGLRLVKLLDYQLVLTLVASIVALGISLHNEGYYKVIYGLARPFQLIIDLVLASLILLFSSTLFMELIIYWFFIDIVVAFIAITMEYGAENLPVAMTYVAMCIAPSDIALLTAWAMLFSKLGLYESLMLPLNEPSIGQLTLDPVISTIIMFGFATKLGQFPLHSWPPIVYSRAPSHVSAILSGIISKIGAYAYFMASQLFSLNPIALYMLLAQGLISTVYGAFGAVLQSNIKRILAYSSVSYSGVITALYAAMMLLDLPPLQLLILAVIAFHAVTKALGFINTGLVYQLTNTYDVTKLGYLFYVSREASMSAFTVLLNVSGLPPSIGFLVKLVLIALSFIIAQLNLIGLAITIAFILSAVLSIVYGAKFMGTYISTLPRIPPRPVVVPRVELNAETYLSVATLVMPALFVLYAITLVFNPAVVYVALAVYAATLVISAYTYVHVFSRPSIPEDVKYWLSGVES